MGALHDRMIYNQHWTDGQEAACDAIQEHAFKLADVLDGMPASREMSLAITKLEECVMWAKRAINANDEQFA